MRSSEMFVLGMVLLEGRGAVIGATKRLLCSVTLSRRVLLNAATPAGWD
jgi:hypothetical protein